MTPGTGPVDIAIICALAALSLACWLVPVLVIRRDRRDDPAAHATQASGETTS